MTCLYNYGSLIVEGSLWIEREEGGGGQMRARQGGGVTGVGGGGDCGGRETRRERVFERVFVIH